MPDDPAVEIVVPRLGLPDDATLAVSVWYAKRGSAVVEGDRLVELSNREFTFDVAAPTSGVLTTIFAAVGTHVVQGVALGMVAPDADEFPR